MINRRELLAALAISPAILIKDYEPLVSADVFRYPHVKGYWIDPPLEWKEGRLYDTYGPKTKTRFRKAFINEEFAGCFSTTKDARFMLDRPVWGEVILRERYMETNFCKDLECRCHNYEYKEFPGYQLSVQVFKETEQTKVSQNVNWSKFRSIGYDKLWPWKHRNCESCGAVATVFSHIGEKNPGFRCMNCNNALWKD